MSLTLENGPWVFDVNNVVKGDTLAEFGQNLAFAMKEIIAGFSAWDVVASSDGSSVVNIGGGSPDLWLTAANVIRSATTHSWIIFDNNIIENVRLTALKGAEVILAPHQTGGCTSNDPN